MDVLEAAKERRTIRRFQDKPVPWETLGKCVEAARLAPYARNVQELDFVAVDEQERVALLNKAVNFGGIVKKQGRAKGEDAKAFIIIISENARSDSDYTQMDAGIAACSIALAAWSQGVGCCLMGSIEREQIKQILGIPEGFSVQLAIAMGFPNEKPVAEEANENDSELDYWIDEGQLHIPKRRLKEVLHRNRF